jgi:hypothetical protein
VIGLLYNFFLKRIPQISNISYQEEAVSPEKPPVVEKDIPEGK